MGRLLIALCVFLSPLRLSAAATVLRSSPNRVSPTAFTVLSPSVLSPLESAASLGPMAPSLSLGVLPQLEPSVLPQQAAVSIPVTAAPRAANPADAPRATPPSRPAAVRPLAKRLQALSKAAAPLTEAAAREQSSPSGSHQIGSDLIRVLNGESGPSAYAGDSFIPEGNPSDPLANSRGTMQLHFLQAGAKQEPPGIEKAPPAEIAPAEKRTFRIYAAGVSAVKVGIETLHFVVPLLLLDHYGAASLVGGLFVASDLAGLVLGWVGSSWIDRLKPGRVMTLAAIAQGLAIGVIPASLFLGIPLGLPLVMGLVVANGAASGLFDIARRAQMPQMLGTDEGVLRRYNGELYVWREIAAISGVFGAGALLAATGYLQTLILHPAFYLIAGYLFWRMSRGNRAAAAPAPGEHASGPRGIKAVWAEALKGFHIVRRDPKLLLATLVNIPIITIHNLFHKMLAAVYAVKILGNPGAAAILLGVWNLGEFASAIYLRTRGHRDQSFGWLRIAAVAGLGVWGLWAFPTIWAAVPIVFLLASTTLSNELGLASFFQSRVPKEDSGAVNGFVYSLASGLSMVALIGLGWAFDAWGATTGILALAIAVTGSSIFYWFASSRLKNSPAAAADSPPKGNAADSLVSAPAAVEKKAAKKKESRRFFRRWKALAAIAFVIAAGAFGAYKYFGPRLDQISPPDSVVIVDKSPYQMVEDLGAAISRSGQNPSIVLSGHDTPVRSFSIRADRKAAVSVDQNGAWKLWDLETGKAYAPSNYPGKVRTALFADEGRQLILVDEDGTVRVSTLRTGEVQTIGRNLESVRFDAISPDAQRVTLGTSDNKVHVLELGTAKPTAFAVGGQILAVGSTEAGEMVLTSSKGIVKLWKIEAGKEPTVVIEKYLPGLKIKGSSLSRSGDRLLALAEMAGDQIVLAWRFGTEDVQMLMAYDFAGEDATLAGVATTPDGSTMAILGTDGRLWTWTPGQDAPVQIGKAASGSKVFFSKTGTTIWTADRTGRLQAWIVPAPPAK